LKEEMIGFKNKKQLFELKRIKEHNKDIKLTK